MVPAVPYCVVLHDELRGDWRGEAQREGRRPVQEFERGGLRHSRLVAGMFGIHVSDNLQYDQRVMQRDDP